MTTGNMQRDHLQGHYPREHYNSHGKAKNQFNTEEEALLYIRRHRLTTSKPYVCGVCNYYHVGKATITKK